MSTRPGLAIPTSTHSAKYGRGEIRERNKGITEDLSAVIVYGRDQLEELLAVRNSKEHVLGTLGEPNLRAHNTWIYNGITRADEKAPDDIMTIICFNIKGIVSDIIYIVK